MLAENRMCSRMRNGKKVVTAIYNLLWNGICQKFIEENSIYVRVCALAREDQMLMSLRYRWRQSLEKFFLYIFFW